MSHDGAPVQRGSGAVARVLLVDDETSILNIVSLLLRRRGFQVDVATNAAQARLAARAEQYDVALVDVRLRDGSGVDLSAELQRECGLGGRVVLMTGGLAPTSDPCVLKPFDPAELVRLVTSLAAQGAVLAARAVESMPAAAPASLSM